MASIFNSRLPSGSPHFKGVYRQNKQSDYDLKKAVCEFIDNPLLTSSTIKINVRVTDSRIQTITISDDADGFENMFEPGIANPFNMTHMRAGQDDDGETSQFGIGLKAGAISTGDKLDVYTKVKGKYWHVEMDFLEMCERDEDSFSPSVFEISYEEYKTKHSLPKGSTIVLSAINPFIYKNTNVKDLKDYLIKEISNIYNDFIVNGLKISVNGDEIHPAENIYESVECEPFTRKYTIYAYNMNGEDTYYMTNNIEYYEYITRENKLKHIDKKEATRKYVDLEEKREIGRIQSTFTMFKPQEELPFGRADIYRNGRLYGSWTKAAGAKLDGNKNYNVSRIDITNKSLAKKLGLTFNKNISEHLTNTETSAFVEFILQSTKGLNSNRSTPSYRKLYDIARNKGLNTEGKEPTKKGEPEPPAPPPQPKPAPQHSVEPAVQPEPQPPPQPPLQPVVQPKPQPPVLPTVDPAPVPPVPPTVEPAVQHIDPPTKIPNKPMTIVREYVKGKIEHPRYNEMVEFLKDKEMDINENEITIKIYNLYMDLKRS
jgi:hypothetical protein